MLKAVITGDLIKSRKIAVEDFDVIRYRLEQVLIYLAEKYGAKYDVYRGDSFQVIFPDMNYSIKSALLIRLALKSVDTSGQKFDARIGIGIGAVDVQRTKLRSSTGEAFNLSGIGLDKLKGQNIGVFTNSEEFQTRIDLLIKFVDAKIDNLTQVQIQALYEYLVDDNNNHEEIAKRLKKTRVNTTKLLNMANYQLFSEFIDLFESLKSELIHE
ncbi:MAG: hypothetical protein HRT38_16630 [Alteromonadaceae bacterium]|nr:hypothetical protein [Alteromonadaceae bacterium]